MARIKTKRKYTAGALFAGIGGFCKGFHGHSIETQWACEWDDHACMTYEANFPEVKLFSRDVRSLNVKELEPVDVLHAGFPCQSFSQAGNRSGFDDERGQTFFEIVRLLKDWGSARPSVLVLENSPFLRDGNGGEWFLQVQSAIRRSGYWFADGNAKVLSTHDYTPLPQQRPRLFMVAFSTDHFWDGAMRWPTRLASVEKQLEEYIDFDGLVDDDYYLDRDNKYYRMIDGLRTEDHEIYQLRKYIVRPKKKGICPTLTANMGRGGHNVPFIFSPQGLRKLTEFECAKLQGFDETLQFPDDVPRHARYTQIGNSVAPPIADLIGQALTEKLQDRKNSGNEQAGNRSKISRG